MDIIVIDFQPCRERAAREAQFERSERLRRADPGDRAVLLDADWDTLDAAPQTRGEAILGAVVGVLIGLACAFWLN